jgi:uncharacterized Zn finger protein (UPF0148 family)
MKYGVIVCPSCGKAKGVEAEKKTTTCQCGREIELSRVKLHYSTDSPMELADAVAQANALIAGGEKLKKEPRPRKKGPHAAIAEKAKSVKDPLERMRVIASELTAMNGEFDIDDVRRVSGLLSKDSPEDIVARLQEHNLIYETANGKFRSV